MVMSNKIKLNPITSINKIKALNKLFYLFFNDIVYLNNYGLLIILKIQINKNKSTIYKNSETC